MSIKAQFRDINKKVSLKGIDTYNQFKAKIMKAFNCQNQDIKFYYYDVKKERLVVDDEQSYKYYLEEEDKPKIIVKFPDEDFLNQSFLQKQSKSNNDSAILPKLIDEEPSPQKKSIPNFKKQTKVATIKENTQKQQLSKNEVKLEQLEAKVKVEEKQNTTVHKNIKCNHCKSEVVGIRWKCLDEFDVDVCNRCYEAKVHKANHTLLRIDTEDYLSKINYRDSIYRLFNPNYQESASAINDPIKPWIKEEDIIQNTLEAVNQIWNASKQIARTVANEFDEWEKQWQAKGIKS